MSTSPRLARDAWLYFRIKGGSRHHRDHRQTTSCQIFIPRVEVAQHKLPLPLPPTSPAAVKIATRQPRKGDESAADHFESTFESRTTESLFVVTAEQTELPDSRYTSLSQPPVSRSHEAQRSGLVINRWRQYVRHSMDLGLDFCWPS